MRRWRSYGQRYHGEPITGVWYWLYNLKGMPQRVREEVWRRLGNAVPTSLRYWCCIKAACDAAGLYKSPADVTAIEMLGTMRNGDGSPVKAAR